MYNMKNLMKGAYDLHVHSAPDVLPRRMNDIEMAQRIIASGMGGYAIKSHYFCTSERAQLINELYPECDAIGTLSLNSSVGGINPAAVEMACRSGIKLVWFPTCDSENEQDYIFGGKAKVLPYWGKILLKLREEGINNPTISILKDGKLTDDTLQVLDIIAKYDIILATSHVSHEEAFLLVKEAKARGIKRIVVTHATYPNTFYTVEEQKELISYGAYIEHCYTTFATGKCDFETIQEQIRAVGPKHVILATDLGQKTARYPDEGMQEFAEKLLEKGFTEEEIHTMAVKNPRWLLKKD